MYGVPAISQAEPNLYSQDLGNLVSLFYTPSTPLPLWIKGLKIQFSKPL
jgi:hypothetical protein